MAVFKRMATSHKIFGGFLLAQLSVMLGAGAAYVWSRRVTRQVDVRACQQFATAQSLSMLNLARVDIERALNALSMNRATDRSLRGNFYDEAESALKQVEIACRDFESLSHSEAVDTLWRKLKAPLADW